MIEFFDAFISHASEDKERFVRPLAGKLRAANINVWFDEYSLRVGDSVRRSIDAGLSRSRFGIVVLSPSFFAKRWTEWELDGLLQRKISGEIAILPIWHNVSHQEIMTVSPPLANIFAIQSSLGLEYVSRKLVEVIRPNKSTLEWASEHLQKHGYSPPAITDEWWIELLEFDGSARNVTEWSFPISTNFSKPKKKGQSIAEKAIQRIWQEKVYEENISQITHPTRLLEHIANVSGLEEILKEKIEYLIGYHPLIAIPGFGGTFESRIEEYYQTDRRNALSRCSGATALTRNARKICCSEHVALRDPDFGNYKSSFVTCAFCQGELMGISNGVFDSFDYLVWLLSDSSGWVPSKAREFLLDGFHEWEIWSQLRIVPRYGESEERNLSFYMAMSSQSKSKEVFSLTPKAKVNLLSRIAYALRIMEISSDPKKISEQLVAQGYLESCFKQFKERTLSPNLTSR